jgi:hypothetical protein
MIAPYVDAFGYVFEFLVVAMYASIVCALLGYLPWQPVLIYALLVVSIPCCIVVIIMIYSSLPLH